MDSLLTKLQVIYIIVLAILLRHSEGISIIGDTPTGDVLLFTRDRDICYYNANGEQNSVCFWRVDDAKVPQLSIDMIRDQNMLILSSDDHFYQLKLSNEQSDLNKLLTYSAGVIKDMSVDWLSGNIYYVDVDINAIRAVNAEGGFAVTVLESDGISAYLAVAVDPIERKLYYTKTNNSHSYVEQSDLDGSNNRVIFQNPEAKPYGLAMDHDTGRLYWTDLTYGSIESIQNDGRDHQSLFERPNVYQPYSVTVTEDHVIWTEHEEQFGFLLESGIYWTSKTSGNHSDYDTHLSYYGVHNILWYSSYAQPSGTNGCSSSTYGGCSQLCFAKTVTDVTCKCSLGFRLADDGKNCVPVDFSINENTLFVGDSGFGSIFVVDTNTEVTSVLPLTKEPRFFGGLAVDLENQIIFWAEQDEIVTMNLDGTQQSILKTFSDDRLIVAFEVDPNIRMVFYIDVNNQVLQKMTYDGQTDITIYQKSGILALLLDRQNQHIYCTIDSTSDGRIVRMDYDGENIMNLITFDDERPTGLTADFSRNRLYWLGINSISYANLNGSGIESFTHEVPYNNFIHMQIHNNYLYITDWGNNFQIRRIDARTFQSIERYGKREFLHTTNIAFPVKLNPVSSSTSTTEATETTNAPQTGSTSTTEATETTNAPQTGSTSTTEATEATNAPQTGSTGSNKTGILVGVIVGVIVVLAIAVIVVVAVFVLLRRRRDDVPDTELINEDSAAATSTQFVNMTYQ